jgi:hypothetical protein
MQYTIADSPSMTDGTAVRTLHGGRRLRSSAAESTSFHLTELAFIPALMVKRSVEAMMLNLPKAMANKAKAKKRADGIKNTPACELRAAASVNGLKKAKPTNTNAAANIPAANQVMIGILMDSR